jgi:hypothetical protein
MELLLDGVHPNLTGHREIAMAIMEGMIERGWVPHPPNWRERAENSQEAYRQSMPNKYLFASYFTAASLNVFWGRFHLGKVCIDKALEFNPQDPAALEQKRDIESVLRTIPPYPIRPWGEVEMALQFNADQPW